MKGLFSADSVPSNVPCQAITLLEGHDGPIQCISFTGDGKYCLTGGRDRTVRLWNPTRVDTAYPAPANSRTPTTKSGSAQIPPALPIQTYSYSHEVTAVTTSDAAPSSSSSSSQQQQLLVVTTSNRVLSVTDLVTQRVLRRYTTGHEGRINDVAAWNELMLTAGYDGTVRIWDGRNRSSYTPLQKLTQAKDSVTKVLLDPPRNHIYTASVDGHVRAYDVRQGLTTCWDLDNPVIGLAVSHQDDKNNDDDDTCELAASCLDGAIRLLDGKADSSNGSLLRSYRGAHKAGQYALDCAIWGSKHCVVTGSEDGNAVLYDYRSTKHIQSLMGHTQPTCAVAVSSSDSAENAHYGIIVTGSYDGKGAVWKSQPQ